MNTSEAEIRLQKLRACIFLTMAAVSELDLSAASPEHASSSIRGIAFRVSQGQFPDDVISEAAVRVITCLKWA